MIRRTKPSRGTRLDITHPLARGLVLYQLFNERTGTKTFDLSLNSNHGTLTGGPTWQPDGILFDGNDDLINCGADASLADIFDSGASVSAWIYMNSYGTNDISYVVTKYAAGDNDWIILVENSAPETNALRFINDFDTTGGFWGARDELSTATWYHIAVTYTGVATTNDPVLYVDGQSVTIDVEQTPVGTDGSDAALDLVIGRRPTDALRSFDGIIDNVMVYTRILNAEDIDWLYREPYAMLL